MNPKTQRMMMIASLLAVTLPLSLSFWIISVITSDSPSDIASPVRWLVSLILPLFIASWALRKRSVDKSGAAVGLIVAFVLTISNYCFLVCLLVFFISSSKITRFKESQKKLIETDFKPGGQRNWVQVLCNGGVACQLAILYITERGIASEIPINFNQDYNASWLAIALLGSLACANGDTWASELGAVMSKGDPVLITNFQKVPRGTNGGVTTIGLVVSFLGGLVVGLGFYFALWFSVGGYKWAICPSQWPIIFVGGLLGLLGSIVDSILGATLQYSGKDLVTGRIVESPNDRTEWISGVTLLDNHSVNLVSTLITALLAPSVAMTLWSFT